VNKVELYGAEVFLLLLLPHCKLFASSFVMVAVSNRFHLTCIVSNFLGIRNSCLLGSEEESGTLLELQGVTRHARNEVSRASMRSSPHHTSSMMMATFLGFHHHRRVLERL